MANYTDSRTVFIKEMLRQNLYQTHFFNNNGQRVTKENKDDGCGSHHHNNKPASVKGCGLSKLDEELITEMTYMMEECFYPQDELILNKGDVADSIYFIVDGQIDVTMRSSYS